MLGPRAQPDAWGLLSAGDSLTGVSVPCPSPPGLTPGLAGPPILGTGVASQAGQTQEEESVVGTLGFSQGWECGCNSSLLLPWHVHPGWVWVLDTHVCRV